MIRLFFKELHRYKTSGNFKINRVIRVDNISSFPPPPSGFLVSLFSSRCWRMVSPSAQLLSSSQYYAWTHWTELFPAATATPVRMKDFSLPPLSLFMCEWTTGLLYDLCAWRFMSTCAAVRLKSPFRSTCVILWSVCTVCAMPPALYQCSDMEQLQYGLDIIHKSALSTNSGSRGKKRATVKSLCTSEQMEFAVGIICV